MTSYTITFDPNLFIAGGTEPTSLAVRARPFRAAGWPIPLDSDSFGVKNEVEKTITPEDPTLELEETGLDWCWKFEIKHWDVDTQWVKYAFLTADANFLDMPSIDPSTFDPEAPLDPAWLAGLAAETAARQAADTNLQTQINNIVSGDLVAVSTDASFGLPAPTGSGFEAIITANVLEGFTYDGVIL